MGKMHQELKAQIEESLKASGLYGEFSKLSPEDKNRLRKALDGIFAEILGGYGAVKDAREAEKEALKKGERLAKADFTISLSQAPHLPFFPFVLPVPARMHPQDFPLLARIPRLVAPQGDKAIWKAVVNVWERTDYVSPPSVALGESPSSPEGAMTKYVEFTAPFKALQVWKKVTFMAQAAARTFADLLVQESINAIVALHAGEENLIINGDSTSNPNQFDGLHRFIVSGITVGNETYGGVVLNLHPSGATQVTQLDIDHVMLVAQEIYRRGTAYPKIMVVHPNLVPTLAKLWQTRFSPVVAPGVPLTHPAVVGGAFSWPMVLPGMGEIEVVACRWMPVRTISVGGQNVRVSDIYLLDPDEELPGRIHAYTERGNAIEMWDLQPTVVGWFAPITLTYRIAAYKFTTLVVRAPILQGAIVNVPISVL